MDRLSKQNDNAFIAGKSFGGTPRYYRHSRAALSRAVDAWLRRRPKIAFALHLGDVIDGLAPKVGRSPLLHIHSPPIHSAFTPGIPESPAPSSHHHRSTRARRRRFWMTFWPSLVAWAPACARTT